MKAQHKSITFPCKDLILEGMLAWPENQKLNNMQIESQNLEKGALWAGIVCHPHPLYGGNMDNNVVMGVWWALLEARLVAMRFNFRGTGKSQGKHGGGGPEQEDVRAAIDYLEAQDHLHQGGIILAGYSFGAMVGLRIAVEDTRVLALIAIAPPLSIGDFSFLEDCSKPQLIIAGDDDFVCPNSLVEEFFRRLEGPKRLSLISGADHSLFGHETEVRKVITDFINSLP